MKQPDDSHIGGARKTLLTRKVHKLSKSGRSASSKKPASRKTIFDRASEQEWLRIFDEK